MSHAASLLSLTPSLPVPAHHLHLFWCFFQNPSFWAFLSSRQKDLYFSSHPFRGFFTPKHLIQPHHHNPVLLFYAFLSFSCRFFPSYFSLQERGKGDTKQRYEAEVKLSAQSQNDSMGEQTLNSVSHTVLTFQPQFLPKVVNESSSLV